MSRERMTGDATGHLRGAKGIDGVGSLAPLKKWVAIRKPKMPKVKRAPTMKGFR
jgi:hypothetical protein